MDIRRLSTSWTGFPSSSAFVCLLRLSSPSRFWETLVGTMAEPRVPQLGADPLLKYWFGTVILATRILFVRPSPYNFKKLPYHQICMVTLHSEQEVLVNVLVLLYKISYHCTGRSSPNIEF
jgi:hypothetical protein